MQARVCDKEKNNTIKPTARVATIEHGEGQQKILTVHATGDGTWVHAKNYFVGPLQQANSFLQEEHPQRAESGLGGQNVSVYMLEGSGEHSPMGEQDASQTKSLGGNNRAVLETICPQERMADLIDNPPTQESASGNCIYNKKLSDIHSISGTNSTEFEVHPRVRHKRHSETGASIRKILSLALEEAVNMGENYEVSDDDFISASDFNAAIKKEERTAIGSSDRWQQIYLEQW
ncbi:hypothetical protein SCA6_009768 [Theobroma cacao]